MTPTDNANWPEPSQQAVEDTAAVVATLNDAANIIMSKLDATASVVPALVGQAAQINGKALRAATTATKRITKAAGSMLAAAGVAQLPTAAAPGGFPVSSPGVVSSGAGGCNGITPPSPCIDMSEVFVLLSGGIATPPDTEPSMRKFRCVSGVWQDYTYPPVPMYTGGTITYFATEADRNACYAQMVGGGSTIGGNGNSQCTIASDPSCGLGGGGGGNTPPAGYSVFTVDISAEYSPGCHYPTVTQWYYNPATSTPLGWTPGYWSTMWPSTGPQVPPILSPPYPQYQTWADANAAGIAEIAATDPASCGGIGIGGPPNCPPQPMTPPAPGCQWVCQGTTWVQVCSPPPPPPPPNCPPQPTTPPAPGCQWVCEPAKWVQQCVIQPPPPTVSYCCPEPVDREQPGALFFMPEQQPTSLPTPPTDWRLKYYDFIGIAKPLGTLADMMMNRESVAEAMNKGGMEDLT